MTNLAKNLALPLIIALFIFSGCATVPKEVVELSYTVGQDIQAVHSSYRELVHAYFEGLRNKTEDFLYNKWNPAYIKDFVKNGGLIERVHGTDPAQVLGDVQLWAEVAVEEIEGKRKEMLDRIDRQEKELLAYVDDAFSKIMRANSAITAHLNSIRKVEAVQDEVLQTLKVKDLKDEVNRKLAAASTEAENAIGALSRAEGIIEKADKLKSEIKGTLKGEGR
ncbi:MAG: hypothetical protein HZB61_11290 [Nitrospirae bacterium]|nr:hypothetical protein [Nitrospirota bacterium]